MIGVQNEMWILKQLSLSKFFLEGHISNKAQIIQIIFIIWKELQPTNFTFTCFPSQTVRAGQVQFSDTDLWILGVNYLYSKINVPFQGADKILTYTLSFWVVLSPWESGSISNSKVLSVLPKGNSDQNSQPVLGTVHACQCTLLWCVILS